MTLDVALVVAGLAVASGAVLGIAILIRGSAPAARSARAVLTGALALTVAWVATDAAIAIFSPVDSPGTPAHTGDIRAMALVGALSVATVTLLLLGGVERLPGVIDTPQNRLRRRIDGLLTTSSLFMAGWIVFRLVNGAAPKNLLHPRWPQASFAIVAIATAAALALAAVTTVRAVHSRWIVLVLMSGVTVTVAGGGGVVVAIMATSAAWIVASGVAVAFGLATVGWASSPRRGLTEPSTIPTRLGWATSAVVVTLALGMIVVQLVAVGPIDGVALIAGVVTGFSLVGRQAIALIDASRLTQQLRVDEIHLKELAYTDPLTAIGNRRHLLRVLNEDAVGGPPCALLAIDLDGFKNINDLRGHDVGDKVLAEVGTRLRNSLRAGDVAARTGGDEFAVLMWAGSDVATATAERLLGTLSEPYLTAIGTVFISASIGVAGCKFATDVPSLMRNADLALRSAKQKGKGRAERYDAAYDEEIQRRTTIEQELRGAVAARELTLFFQPIVSLPDGRPVGVEALVRWTNAKLGRVGPDEFIPIAEEAGLIAGLDRWVLHEACRQLSRWLDDGHDLWLSVNVSARELHLVDYVDQVIETLRIHHVPPDRLVVEITEHTVALDLDELVTRLGALRVAGVRIALDDFGSGYASLGQLRNLPVDILKIDRSLVGDPELGVNSREAAPLVDVVVQLGRRLELQVIAEGIEKPAERRVVEGAGCVLGQGDLLAPAMPAEYIEALLVETAQRLIPPQRGGQARDTGRP